MAGKRRDERIPPLGHYHCIRVIVANLDARQEAHVREPRPSAERPRVDICRDDVESGCPEVRLESSSAGRKSLSDCRSLVAYCSVRFNKNKEYIGAFDVRQIGFDWLRRRYNSAENKRL